MKNQLTKYLLLVLILGSMSVHGQTTLRQQIEQILSNKNLKVGVSVIGANGRDTLSINGDVRFPMQSVFKLHIALVMLSEIDKGRFSLDQKIEIQKKDLLPDLYSPLRDQHPEGAILPISEIMSYTVSMSDNVGCDILLRLLGGPQAVEKYFVNKGFAQVKVKYNEEQQQGNWDLQFENWTTPKATSRLLKMFFENKRKILSQRSYDFIWQVMKSTETGKNRIKGLLPVGTVVAHKTGTSGQNKVTGITAAVNDVGVVFLPDGRYYFISFFVGESKEDAQTNEKVIAEISKAVWDYFNSKK
jgi:beta-lactamase class A